MYQRPASVPPNREQMAFGMPQTRFDRDDLVAALQIFNEPGALWRRDQSAPG